jgi:hypothetical protein
VAEVDDYHLWSELTQEQRARYLSWGYARPDAPPRRVAGRSIHLSRLSAARRDRLIGVSLVGGWMAGLLYLILLIIGVSLSIAGVQIR